MPEKILVVDNHSSVRQMFHDYLSAQGFNVLVASNGEEALYTARHQHPDLILLDIMMPKMDGYEFIRKFRGERNTPIIMVTARKNVTDMVLGLELGSDDYLVKPFPMRLLLARIRAVLRRSGQASNGAEVFHYGEIILDERHHTVSVKEAPISLTPLEFSLLSIFIREPGRVFTRVELAHLLADDQFTGIDRTLNVHIRNLRAKIEPKPGEQTYIETVFGVGYRFRKNE